jgi:hypothetical protein
VVDFELGAQTIPVGTGMGVGVLSKHFRFVPSSLGQKVDWAIASFDVAITEIPRKVISAIEKNKIDFLQLSWFLFFIAEPHR